MKRDSLATSFGWAFLVTLAVVGPSAFASSCDNVTTCGAKGFVVGPIVLVAFPIAGFVAGRVSTSTPIGFAAILTATTLVASLGVITGIWYTPPEGEGGSSASVVGLALTGLTLVLMLPGFLIGRDRYKHADLVNLDAQRNAGTISSEEFVRQLALRGRTRSQDQAAADHQCGRCGRPLSPVWHGKCLHCGAKYAEYPPVPRTSAPE